MSRLRPSGYAVPGPVAFLAVMEDLRLDHARCVAADLDVVPGRLLAGPRRAGAYQGGLEAKSQRWPGASIGRSYSSAQGCRRRTFPIFFQAGDLLAEAPARDAGAGRTNPCRPAPANDIATEVDRG